MSRRRHNFRQSDFGIDVLRDVGPYCKNCRKRINWTKLNTRYEIDSFRQIWRIRFCPRCGKMLDEMNLEDLALRLEIEERDTIKVQNKNRLATPRIIDFRLEI